MVQANMCEQQRNYTGPCRSYLTITREHINGLDQLERRWNAAALLAIEYLHDQMQRHQVLSTVSRRLVEIECHDV